MSIFDLSVHKKGLIGIAVFWGSIGFIALLIDVIHLAATSPYAHTYAVIFENVLAIAVIFFLTVAAYQAGQDLLS